MTTTVVRDGIIWTGGANPTTHARRDLVIENGTVAAIEPYFRGRADVEIDAGGCLVVPGLINAHVHAGCSPQVRGLTEDAPIPKSGAYYHALGSFLTMGYQQLSRDEFAALSPADQADVRSMFAGTGCDALIAGL